MAFPNVRLSKRPLHFIYVCDCSGSMAAQGKMQALNQAIRQSLPGMAEVARQNPEARVLVRAIRFADQAAWHVAEPTPVEQLEWHDLQAGGITAMGEALELVGAALQSPPMEERALPPVLVLISDGQPTDDFDTGLARLMRQPWAQKAVRLAIAMGHDADLEVLQQFTELGAGFSIASHDLEIRGAGNLLGPDQSGTIASVGFELYSELLDEAIHELKGEPPQEHIDPEVTLSLPAFIPDTFVTDVHQRLVLYKRFSQVSTGDDLQDLRTELVDRFGELPIEVDHLGELALLRLDLLDLGLRALESGPARLVFTLGQSAKLDPAKMAGFIQRGAGKYKLTPDMKLVAKIPEEAKVGDLIQEAKRVLKELRALKPR